MSPEGTNIAVDKATMAKTKKEKPTPPDISQLYGYFYEDLSVGMSDVYSRTITEADIVGFASISGDTNPIHLSEDFAKDTMFGGMIAHGMLTASFFSTIIGTKLPGPGCIYVTQGLRFKAPVRAGDTVNARAAITALNDEKDRITLWCEGFVGDTVVVEGEAIIQVPRREPIE